MIMLSVNKKKLLRILFQTVCLFLPWLATTSSTMLNRSGESRHSCLVSELGESIQSFNIKNGASCRIFIDVLYQDEKVPFQSWFAEGFFSSFFKIENGCWILSHAFFASIEILIWFLSFILLMWCTELIDLRMLSHACVPEINPTNHGEWSFYCVIECGLLIFFCRFLHLYLSGILACNFLFLWCPYLALVSG